MTIVWQQHDREQIVRYIRAHGLPAEIHGESILTVNEFIAPDKTFHSEPVLIPATFAAVREWLGYYSIR